MAATIKAEMELDAGQFVSSAKQAKDAMDGMSNEASVLAESINRTTQANSVAEASIKSYRKTLNEQKAIIQDCALKMAVLGDQAKNTEGFKALQEQMLTATEKAKQYKTALDAAKESVAFLKNGTGVQTQSQFDDGDKITSYKAKLRELKGEITDLTIKYREMSDAEKASAEGMAMSARIEQATAEAANYADALGDVSAEIKNRASDTATWDAIAGSLDIASSAMQAYVSIAGFAGGDTEKLSRMISELAAVLNVANTAIKIGNALLKQSSVMSGINTVKRLAETAAEKLKTAATVLGTVATKAATVAQAAFNAVANANPYVLLASVILGVGTALYSLVSYLDSSAEAEEKAQKKAEELKKKQEELKAKEDELTEATSNTETSFMKLKTEWENLQTTAEKKKWIEDNKSAFTQMGFAINDVTTADKIFCQQSDKVIQALLARTVATIKAKQAAEELVNLEKNRKQKSTKTGDYYKTAKAGQKFGNGNITQDEAKELTRLGYGSDTEFTKESAAALNKYRNNVANQKRKQRQKWYDDQKKSITKEYTDAVKDAQKASNDISSFGDKTTTKTRSSKSSKTTKNDADRGTVDWYKSEQEKIEKQLHSKNVKNVEELQRQWLKLNDARREAEYKIGDVQEGSVKDIANEIDEINKKHTWKLISDDDYKSQMKELNALKRQAEIIEKYGFDPNSYAGLNAQKSELETGLKEGSLNISTEDAQKQIRELNDKIKQKGIEIGIEPKPGTGDYIRQECEQFLSDVKMGLHPELSAEEVKEQVKKYNRSANKADIELGVSPDYDDAVKSFNELKKNMNNGGATSSFDIALGLNNVNTNLANSSTQSYEEELDAIHAMMDANDDWIAQLKTAKEELEEMDMTGTETYENVTSSLNTLIEAQEKLAKKAKVIDTTSKSGKKLKKNMNDSAEAVSSLASAMSGFSSVAKDLGFDIGIAIAQAIATIIGAYAEKLAADKTSDGNIWAFIAAAAAATISMAATIASIKSNSSYASGGIISGMSTVGDRNLARVNNGEMVINDAQQHRLWNIISGSESWNYSRSQPGATVAESRVQGRDLVLCLKNNEHFLNKQSKSLGIKL